MFHSDVPTVGPTEVPAQVTVLDVREDDEWDAGHVEGAVHIPLGDLPARVGELDPEADIVVVCRSGGRSARATAWLVQNGYDAANLDGGMGAWVDAGHPIVSDSGSPFVK